ncbi:hypothetical protein FS935_10530 [Metabacillus litoralis]|uniref:Lipoprotein n=1 Tax=Metabacillus litoralis TaxID=152268 RepID=A0A5C6W0D1_9BACI|nr:hypothetical protein [Metabacillus litoralis]TXC91318.1 hypothetical protein FS935_10530 [Metabacillus litoralis]
MKKIWFLISTLVLSIALTACSEESNGAKDEKDSTNEEAEAETEDAAKNAKSAMMQFYMSVSKAINSQDGDLNTYEASEEEPTAEMKTSAEASATAVVAELEKVEIPEQLKDQKADLEAALKDLTNSYQAKADELKKDTPSLEAANETFTKAEDQIGKAFESVGLNASSLGTEVNG